MASQVREVRSRERFNGIEICLPSRLGFEKIGMDAAATFAALQGLDKARCNDLKTAVSEACINAIEHGNRFGVTRPVKIRMKVHKKVICIEIEDAGQGFDGAAVKPVLEKKLAGAEPARGWGVFLIQELVDEVEYVPGKKQGNTTRLKMHIEHTVK